MNNTSSPSALQADAITCSGNVMLIPEGPWEGRGTTIKRKGRKREGKRDHNKKKRQEERGETEFQNDTYKNEREAERELAGFTRLISQERKDMTPEGSKHNKY